MIAMFFNCKRTAFLVLSITALLCGCATQKVNWAARVGHYSYDQAVIELGPPDKQAKLTDGSVVADWITNRGYTRTTYVGYGYGYPHRYYGPVYPDYATTYASPDYVLRLVFGTDGQLSSWKNFWR